MFKIQFKTHRMFQTYMRKFKKRYYKHKQLLDNRFVTRPTINCQHRKKYSNNVTK